MRVGTKFPVSPSSKQQAVDQQSTLWLHTHGTDPPGPTNRISNLGVRKRVACGAASADLNGWRAEVGSGPYRLRECLQGERAPLERIAPRPR